MADRKNARDTWERILESAETLFARQGFSGTSTRQIAAEAGVSIQTLQYHCGGKNNLYQKVLERTVIPDLRSVEWEGLTPVLRRWSKEVESQLDAERLRDTNLFLLFMSLSWMYWGLFVQPPFIARYLGIDAGSPEFLRVVKDHAWEMTIRMMGQRRSSSVSPFKRRAKARKRGEGAGKKKGK